jgi:N-acyl-D-aspartate/D-glutamate deacylase
MERLLDAALCAGAHGMSSGLVYPPGCFASTEELLRLCRVVARHQGIYTTHVRGERETILEAVGEALALGRAAGIPVDNANHSAEFVIPAGYQHATPGVGAAEISGTHGAQDHTFQGAWLFCHRSSSLILSRSVSIGCQKPSWV